MYKKITIIFFLFVLIITSGFGCKLQTAEEKQALEPITLKYWRVWDDSDSFDEIIEKYRALHPNVNIQYKKLRFSEYEQELLEAWSEDRGPDIFSIHNTWMRDYEPRILPLPAQTKMAYQYTTGSIKKEVVTEVKATKSLTPKDIKDDFIDVVYGDTVIPVKNEDTEQIDEKIYGLPLSVDTLALYYNKDLLNNAGIAEAPEYWDTEFQQAVKKLTKQDVQGNIIQSGIALGGSVNIERYSDILSLLMMQNGAQMMNNSSVTFHQIPTSFKSQGLNPGMDALHFYADFANPAKEVYCWNTELDNSLDLFMQGKLAMMLGYSYHLPTIKAGAPKLNFAIAKAPQIHNMPSVNFANYWLEVVSRKTKNVDAAWDFLQFAAREENVQSYLDKTKKPTALRSLVNEQIEDPSIGIFADQLLTAKSWYKGDDAQAAEEIIGDMIDNVVQGAELREAINLGARQVQQTIY